MEYFWADFQASGTDLIQFLNAMTKEYAHLADFNIRFSNIIVDYVLPQRTFIPGFVIGTAAVYFLWRYWENQNARDLFIAGIAISLLPLIHMHTFVALLMAAVFLAVFDIASGVKTNLFSVSKAVRAWLIFALPVFIIALPQVLAVFPSGSNNFMRIQLGWMKGNDTFWEFWGKNLGLHLPVILLALVFAPKKIRGFYFAFLGIFIVSNVVIFSPHDYDNMKIMLWWYLMSSMLIGILCANILQKFPRLGYPAVALLVLLLGLTGAISVYRESYTSWMMYSRDDIMLADFVRGNTSLEARFLTSDKHNHPISSLAGRQILMGFRGWLWTHGINYEDREKDIMEMYSGGPGAPDLLKKYQVDYVVIERDNLAAFRMNPKFFASQFRFVYGNPAFQLYKITTNDKL